MLYIFFAAYDTGDLFADFSLQIRNIEHGLRQLAALQEIDRTTQFSDDNDKTVEISTQRDLVYRMLEKELSLAQKVMEKSPEKRPEVLEHLLGLLRPLQAQEIASYGYFMQLAEFILTNFPEPEAKKSVFQAVIKLFTEQSDTYQMNFTLKFIHKHFRDRAREILPLFFQKLEIIMSGPQVLPEYIELLLENLPQQEKERVARTVIEKLRDPDTNQKNLGLIPLVLKYFPGYAEDIWPILERLMTANLKYSLEKEVDLAMEYFPQKHERVLEILLSMLEAKDHNVFSAVPIILKYYPDFSEGVLDYLKELLERPETVELAGPLIETYFPDNLTDVLKQYLYFLGSREYGYDKASLEHFILQHKNDLPMEEWTKLIPYFPENYETIRDIEWGELVRFLEDVKQGVKTAGLVTLRKRFPAEIAQRIVSSAGIPEKRYLRQRYAGEMKVLRDRGETEFPNFEEWAESRGLFLMPGDFGALPHPCFGPSCQPFTPQQGELPLEPPAPQVGVAAPGAPGGPPNGPDFTTTAPEEEQPEGELTEEAQAQTPP